MKKLIINRSLKAIAAAFIIITAISCSPTHSPRSTVKHFYEAIEKGDYAKAVSYTTISEEDSELCCAIMDKTSISIKEKGGIKRITVEEEPIKNDDTASNDTQTASDADKTEEAEQRTTLTVKLDYDDGTSQQEFCDMVHRDEKWLIDVNLNSK